jgi:hypothetical protein
MSSYIEYVSLSLKEDKEMVLKAAEQDDDWTPGYADSLEHDKGVVLKAVEQLKKAKNKVNRPSKTKKASKNTQ